MASLPEARPNYRETANGDDPKLGHALERVFDAGQRLIVRRIDLLVEELSALGNQLVGTIVSAALGGVLALVGWVVVLAGIIDALDQRFARHWVAIAIGIVHLAIGVGLLLRRRIARAAS